MLNSFPSKPKDSNAAPPSSRSATASPRSIDSVAGSSKSQLDARNGNGTTGVKADGRPNGPSKLKPKALSSVVVTTVKKKAAPLSSSSHSLSSNAASSARKGAAATNALSEERRKRIAEDRERIERERARKEAASREEVAHSSKHLAHKRRKLSEDVARNGGSGASTPRHKNGRSRASPSDEDESSALSSEDASDGGAALRRKGSVARTKKTSRPGSASPITSSPGGYKKRGREGVTAYYCVPRDNLVENEAFAKACEVNGCETTFLSSKELVEISGMSKYGTCEWRIKAAALRSPLTALLCSLSRTRHLRRDARIPSHRRKRGIPAAMSKIHRRIRPHL